MSEASKTRRGAGRGIKIALAISLALNVAILGIVAGAVLGRDADRRGDGRLPELRSLGLGPFAIALDRDDRAALRDRIEGDSASLHDDRRAIGGALRDVQAALLADPFDRALADAALAHSRGLVDGLQETGHMALLDLVEGMSVAERVELAERLDRIMRRTGGRR